MWTETGCYQEKETFKNFIINKEVVIILTFDKNKYNSL